MKPNVEGEDGSIKEESGKRVGFLVMWGVGVVNLEGFLRASFFC